MYVCMYVCMYVSRNQYGAAFALMKKHKIDLNLLYDHNPQMFLQNIENFVKQVNDVDDLNLFISSLKYSRFFFTSLIVF
jgi:elongator complex protein 1